MKTALGRYDSHVNVLKVCDNGLHRSGKRGTEGENHNLHLKYEPFESKLRRQLMCLLVTMVKKLVATYSVR